MMTPEISARGLLSCIRAFCLLPLIGCLLLSNGVERAIAQAPTAVRVQDLTGQIRSGKLLEISDSKVRFDGPPAVDWKRSDVLRIDWLPQPESLLEDSPQLLLANGDRLGIRPTAITEEALRGKWERFPAWPEVEVPLETLSGALLNPPRNPLERTQAIVRLRDQQETQDCFYLSNGDRLLGQLEGFDVPAPNGTDSENPTKAALQAAKGAFRLTAATGKVSLAAATVRSFGLNPELTSFPPPQGLSALLTLNDGSLLTVSDVRLDPKDALHCRAAFGPEMTFPMEHVVSLRFLGDRIVYLSDLEPEQFTSTPYLSRTWPLRQNQNVIGGPLRLGAKEYARGLGMHSQALATYNLAGKILSFQATIGIDGVTEGRGSVIFRVLADGKPVFTSDVVRGKTPPVNVGPLSMSGVQKLTLAVDFADQGDILDHANWCDAVLIKNP